MPSQTEKIKINEIKEAINSSGYLLEQRIETFLQNKGFYVTANDAYIDPITAKSRELDIDAIYGFRLSKDYDFIFLKLLCECENNKQPIVFFAKDAIDSSVCHYDIKVAGLPVQFLRKERGVGQEEFVSIVDFLHLDKHHHYCKGLVSTQYCSFTRKKTDNHWIAQHVEDQHDSIVDLINALEAQIEEYYESYSLPGKDEKDQMNIELYLPVLILQGDLFTAHYTRSGLQINKTNYIKFRKEYFVKGKRDSYVIDVVTEKHFPSYLKLIVAEFQRSGESLRNKKSIARLSLDKLVEKARTKKFDVSFREVFQP